MLCCKIYTKKRNQIEYRKKESENDEKVFTVIKFLSDTHLIVAVRNAVTHTERERQLKLFLCSFFGCYFFIVCPTIWNIDVDKCMYA